MNRELVRTERLCLTRPRVDDLDRYAELLGDYEVCKMLSRVPYPYDRDEGRARLLGAQDSWRAFEKAEDLTFQIEHQGEVIGCFAFKKLQQTPEIGYWLGSAYWGKGFMSEAARAAMVWLFENTDHTRVACEAMIDNPASIRLAEKIGFRKVAEVGCASVSRGGTVPAVRAEITREEFLNGL
ncbi:GNAT family N-acetyltransferase [Roseibium sp.]|uniref:GNAT family N-acetyltransferase n=1 Tax=Roseibium sp. TaxID=1936156 RepID=UPI00326447FE